MRLVLGRSSAMRALTTLSTNIEFPQDFL
jgi:hypothetical protein